MSIGDHFYTTPAAERDNAVNSNGYHCEAIACYVWPNQVPGTTALFRLVNPTIGDHFYTTSETESASAAAHDGYRAEATACYIFPTQQANTVPLYRLLTHDPRRTDHFYTTSVQERDLATQNGGYQFEGVAGYVSLSSQSGVTIPLWRLFNQPHSVQQATSVNIKSIAYDTTNAVITQTVLLSLYETDVHNATNLSQSTTTSGSKTVTDVSGWQNTISTNIMVSASGGVKIPFLADGKITVTATQTNTYVWNGSQTVANAWSWSQPVIVPANSSIHVSVVLSQSTLSVPYSAVSEFRFADGSSYEALIFGIYTGVSSHDMKVKFQTT